MIQINVNVADNASPALREVISALTGQQATEINQGAGRAAQNAAIKHHRTYDQNNGWRGTRYLGPGKGDGTSFGAAVAAGWAMTDADKNGVTLTNDARYYAFKVRGGTITPKRAKYLTIPLIAEARGLYVSVYQQNTGKRLFRPKGKDVLMEKTPDGGVRSVYALVKSVTMKPWPNALPDRDALAEAYAMQWKLGLTEHIDTL